MKRLVLVALLGTLLASIIGLYLYYKPVKDLSKSKPDFTFSDLRQLNELFQEIETNPSKYIGKIFQISGIVSDFSIEPQGGGYVVLASKESDILVNAQLDHRVVDVKIRENSPCTIKAEFTGMEEDLLNPGLTIFYFKQAVIAN